MSMFVELCLKKNALCTVDSGGTSISKSPLGNNILEKLLKMNLPSGGESPFWRFDIRFLKFWEPINVTSGGKESLEAKWVGILKRGWARNSSYIHRSKWSMELKIILNSFQTIWRVLRWKLMPLTRRCRKWYDEDFIFESWLCCP
jgi:hypothetical protein